MPVLSTVAANVIGYVPLGTFRSGLNLRRTVCVSPGLRLARSGVIVAHGAPCALSWYVVMRSPVFWIVSSALLSV